MARILADRAALQSEVDALEAEIDRISENTTWASFILTVLKCRDNFSSRVDSGQTITHSIADMASTAGTMSIQAANSVNTHTGAMSYKKNYEALSEWQLRENKSVRL